MSAKMIEQAWTLKMWAYRRLVLVALADEANDDGQVVIDADYIGWKTGLSFDDTTKTILRFIEHGILIAEDREVNRYRLNFEAGKSKKIFEVERESEVVS